MKDKKIDEIKQYIDSLHKQIELRDEIIALYKAKDAIKTREVVYVPTHSCFPPSLLW